MRAEVMTHYGLVQPLSQAGYYETDHHKRLLQDIRGSILEGRLIVLHGIIGSGKTITLRRLQRLLKEENRVTVSKSLAVEKHSVKLGTLITALFYDLTPDKQPVQIPTQSERRERELRERIKKAKRPVALFVDEAHDLSAYTLTGLKRLIEMVEDGDGRLSVVLAGWPKLKNDLRRPTMQEIGYRTDIFSLDGIAGSQREYIHWLLSACTHQQVEPESIVTAQAIDLLASKLRTPLQIEWHLTQALEAGYQTGGAPISAELIEMLLSKQLDDPETILTSHGYRLRDLVEQFDARAAEIKALFSNTLDAVRTNELRDRMRAEGLPI
jgi:type II secretory pathway predicted ATPase ExeA